MIASAFVDARLIGGADAERRMLALFAVYVGRDDIDARRRCRYLIEGR